MGKKETCHYFLYFVRTEPILCDFEGLILISAHLDVSVRDVNVMEKMDGCANVPHDLGCLWEEERKNTISQTRSNSDISTAGEANLLFCLISCLTLLMLSEVDVWGFLFLSDTC